MLVSHQVVYLDIVMAEWLVGDSDVSAVAYSAF